MRAPEVVHHLAHDAHLVQVVLRLEGDAGGPESPRRVEVYLQLLLQVGVHGRRVAAYGDAEEGEDVPVVVVHDWETLQRRDVWELLDVWEQQLCLLRVDLHPRALCPQTEQRPHPVKHRDVPGQEDDVVGEGHYPCAPCLEHRYQVVYPSTEQYRAHCVPLQHPALDWQDSLCPCVVREVERLRAQVCLNEVDESGVGVVAEECPDDCLSVDPPICVAEVDTHHVCEASPHQSPQLAQGPQLRVVCPQTALRLVEPVADVLGQPCGDYLREELEQRLLQDYGAHSTLCLGDGDEPCSPELRVGFLGVVQETLAHCCHRLPDHCALPPGLLQDLGAQSRHAHAFPTF